MGDVIEGVFVSGRHGVGKASPRKLETRVVTPQEWAGKREHRGPGGQLAEGPHFVWECSGRASLRQHHFRLSSEA